MRWALGIAVVLAAWAAWGHNSGNIAGDFLYILPATIGCCLFVRFVYRLFVKPKPKLSRREENLGPR